MSASLPNQASLEILVYAQLRKRFKIPKSTLDPQLFPRFADYLKQCPIVYITLLDGYFFRELFSRLSQLQKTKVILEKMKSLIEMIELKLLIFEELITEYWNVSEAYLKFKYPQFSSSRQNIGKQLREILELILPNTMKFLDLFYKKSKIVENQKYLRIRVSDVKVESDKKLIGFIRDETYKLFSANSSISKQNQPINQSIDFKLSFEEKQLSEKIMLEIKEINNKYNPQMKKNQAQKQNSSASVPIQAIRKNIEIEDFVSSKCLNCAQFFYIEVPFQNQRNSLVDYELVPSIKSIRIQQQRDKILQNITAFLNNGGGTLLFNCKPTAFGFIPIGFQMTLKEQEAYKYSFENLLKFIQPESSQKFIECDIDFIPLKANPFLNVGKVITNRRQPYVQRQFVKDFYIMRVKIKPKSERQFFGCELDFKTYFYVRNKNSTVQIAGSQFYQNLKRKSLQLYRLNSMSQVQKIESRLNHSLFNSLIRGSRQYAKDLHEAPCKQTLILSANSNNR